MGSSDGSYLQPKPPTLAYMIMISLSFTCAAAESGSTDSEGSDLTLQGSCHNWGMVEPQLNTSSGQMENPQLTLRRIAVQEFQVVSQQTQLNDFSTFLNQLADVNPHIYSLDEVLDINTRYWIPPCDRNPPRPSVPSVSHLLKSAWVAKELHNTEDLCMSQTTDGLRSALHHPRE